MITLSKAFPSLKEMLDIVININCYTSTRNESFNPIYPLGRKPFHSKCLKEKGPFESFNSIYLQDYPTLFILMQLMNSPMQDDKTL
jgi:hypothetical protein